MCADSEVCIYNDLTGTNECLLNEWVHELGGTTIIAFNSFVGVTDGNSCIDTLIFINDTTRTYGQFSIYVENPPGIVQNVLGAQPPFEASDNEYYSSTVAPFCNLNGDALYGNLHFKVEPDSVWMNIKFWALDGEPGEFIDSCNLVFYRKH
jgi:hypothetical protein